MHSRHTHKVVCTGVSCQHIGAMRYAARRESARRFRIKHTDMREFTRFDRLAKISAIDAEARVVHSRSSINTRGSCKVLQSQLSFVPAYSCVFSFPVYCTLLKLLAIHGVPAELYIWRSQRDYRNISKESQFSERRIESPLDAYGYRVLPVIY